MDIVNNNGNDDGNDKGDGVVTSTQEEKKRTIDEVVETEEKTDKVTPQDQQQQKIIRSSDSNDVHSNNNNNNNKNNNTTGNNGHKITRREKREKFKENKKKMKEEKLKKQQEGDNGEDEAGNITSEVQNETSYYIQGSLRHVHPYSFLFKVNAKERWFGRTLLSMFTDEFSQLPERIYRQKIEQGWIKVNGSVSSVDRKVKLNDVIEHRVHRHEPPVTSAKINIVHVCDEYIAVDKPPSIPIHPCGRFRHNTLTFILAKEYGFPRLFGVHRLDRLTSGLLIMARTSSSASKLGKSIMNHLVTKKYLALVKGRFPDTQDLECNQPLKVQNHRLGLNMVSPDGKPAVTHFNLVSYNSETDTSVVCCIPKTGRTHQIRLHLQWLGYPIANDPLYNEEFKSKCGKILTSDGLEGLGGFNDEGEEENETTTTTTTSTTETTNNNNKTEEEDINNDINNNNNNENKKEKKYFEGIECLDCNIVWNDESTYSFGIYLHAFSYVGSGFSFQTQPPQWALDHKDTRTPVEIAKTNAFPNSIVINRQDTTPTNETTESIVTTNNNNNQPSTTSTTNTTNLVEQTQ